MNMDDFWRSLGLNPGSSPEQIKKAYRALVVKHHPDKPDGDAEKFREVHHAYKMLTDPSYSYQNTPKEHPVRINTSISIEQAVFGTIIKHTLTKNNYATPEYGTNVEAKAVNKVIELIDTIPPKSLNFPFTITRSQVDLGDRKAVVMIVYNLTEHPYYKVTQGRILVDVELTAIQALKGTKLEVQTLFGIKTLRIPAGTVPEDTFFIKDHGHLDPLIVRIAGIKYPRKAEMKASPEYHPLGVNWESEEETDRQEQEELDRIFNSLGGKL